MSQQVLEWQAEARRDDLLRFLARRHKAPVPSDLVEAIQAATDMDLLSRWVDAAAAATTLDEFRAAMQSQT